MSLRRASWLFAALVVALTLPFVFAAVGWIGNVNPIYAWEWLLGLWGPIISAATAAFFARNRPNYGRPLRIGRFAFTVGWLLAYWISVALGLLASITSTIDPNFVLGEIKIFLQIGQIFTGIVLGSFFLRPFAPIVEVAQARS
jgi:hypothetical protein